MGMILYLTSSPSLAEIFVSLSVDIKQAKELLSDLSFDPDQSYY